MYTPPIMPVPAGEPEALRAAVPGFEHDIFISYAHFDNLIEDKELEQSGWVDRFRERLRVRLCKELGVTVKIWFDHAALKQSDEISPTIDEAIKGSAVFLVLISNRSLLSKSCQQEVSLIARAVKDGVSRPDTGTQSAVFPILLYNIHHQKWPDVCQGKAGFTFFKDSEEGRAGRPFDPTDDHLDLKREFNKLVSELTELLNRLGAKRPAAPAVAGGSFRVFLTAAPGERLVDRQVLTAAFDKVGIDVIQRVVPPRYKADEHEADLRDCLAQADLSLHLVDHVAGGPVEGAESRHYPEEQCRIAYEVGHEQLVILPEAPDIAAVQAPSHKAFLQRLLDCEWPNKNPAKRLTIAKARQPDVILQYVRQARDRKFAPAPAVPLQPGGFAFVDTTVRDLMLASELLDFLEKNALKPIAIPTSEDSPDDYEALFAENVVRAAALIIIYGHVRRSWVKTRLIRASDLIIGRDLLIHPVVYAALSDKSDEDLKFRQCVVADCRRGFNEPAVRRALESHG